MEKIRFEKNINTSSAAGIKKRCFWFGSLFTNLGFAWLSFLLYIHKFGTFSIYFSYVLIILNGLQVLIVKF